MAFSRSVSIASAIARPAGPQTIEDEGLELGVAKSAKNKNEAIQFVEFLSSPQGSRLIADPTYEYPLKGFGTSKELKKFGQFIPDNVSISALGATQRSAIQVMAQAGWR